MPPRIASRIAVAAAFLTVLAPFLITPSATADTTPVATRSTLSEWDEPLREMFAEINQVRANHHLHPLRPGPCLTTRIAQPWAERMARTDEFEHSDLDVGFRRCPRKEWLGENIAYGYATPRQAMRAFMGSPPHRHNLLTRRWRFVGLGMAVDKNGVIYWSQNFGN